MPELCQDLRRRASPEPCSGILQVHLTTLLPMFACILAAPATGSVADCRAIGASVVVNEVVVARIRTKVGTLSPEARAAVIAQSLDTFQKGEVTKVTTEGGVKIVLEDRPVVTISPEEAKAAGSTPEGLAANWAKAMNKALYLPSLVVEDPGELQLPVSGSVSLSVLGSSARTAQIGMTPESLASVKRLVGKIQITAKQFGTGSLVISAAGREKRLNLLVAPYAAQFPQNVVAQVTGQPAPAEIVESAARSAVLANVAGQPGKVVQIESIDSGPLQPGNSKVFTANVTVSALGCLPTTGTVNVLVTNRGGGRMFEDELWYSNNPENVTGAASLYWGRLQSGVPVRLLWHHFNKSTQGLYVQYVAVNRSDLPASLHVLAGDAEPDKDPTRAGFEAGELFWRSWMPYAGQVVQIPPYSVVPLVFRRIAPGETTSGLASLRLLSGGSDDLVVIGNCMLPAEGTVRWQKAANRPNPWSLASPISISQFPMTAVGVAQHVYARPALFHEIDYKCGGPFEFVRLGADSIKGINGEGELLGNFGVHYMVEGQLSNPTDKPAKVVVEFEASAGYSGAMFLVNGKFVKSLMQTKETLVLFEKLLQPGETQPIRIETMPLSGAHYPAKIIVRPPHI